MESNSSRDTSSPVSVLIAIRNAGLRTAFATNLKSASNGSLQIVGEVGARSQATAIFKKHKPDVLVVDLKMRGGGFVAMLKEQQPSLRVVMIVQLNGQGSLANIARYEADAYVHQDDSVEEHLGVILTGLGRSSFSGKVLEELRVKALPESSVRMSTAGHKKKLTLLDATRMAEAFFAGLPPANPNWPEDVQHGYSFLNQNLSDSSLTPQDIRHHCKIRSDRPFDVAFRYCTECSIKSYMTEHRLQAAKKLLSCGCSNCTFVASAVGYTSENGFSNAFKRRFRCSPKQFLDRGLT